MTWSINKASSDHPATHLDDDLLLTRLTLLGGVAAVPTSIWCDGARTIFGVAAIEHLVLLRLVAPGYLYPAKPYAAIFLAAAGWTRHFAKVQMFGAVRLEILWLWVILKISSWPEMFWGYWHFLCERLAEEHDIYVPGFLRDADTVKKCPVARDWRELFLELYAIKDCKKPKHVQLYVAYCSTNMCANSVYSNSDHFTIVSYRFYISMTCRKTWQAPHICCRPSDLDFDWLSHASARIQARKLEC